MKTINITTKSNIDILYYPDKQPHVKVKNIVKDDDVQVVCAITDSTKLIVLLECVNVLDQIGVNKLKLHIPYLLGARSDRVMTPNNSFDLQVIATLINLCDFKKVYLHDVHSEVATNLINNSVSISNQYLVDKYAKPNSVLICPDKGAALKLTTTGVTNKNITDIVYCEKSRNLVTGDITLIVLEPEKCTDRKCVIIDDICDGGGTFIKIASQIKPNYLTLIITHGIFSKGIGALDAFDKVICSDSYPHSASDKRLKTYPYEPWLMNI